MNSRIIYFCCLFFYVQLLLAATYEIPIDGNVVGELQYGFSLPGETLSETGIRYDIGYNEMVRANPAIDPLIPLSPGTRILIPSLFVLPKATHEGIVINLAEYRLYYFPKDDNVVLTFPVGIGRSGWNTPLGKTKVVEKQRNPVWRPTSKLQKEAAKHGVLIPELFPSGPDNPLGQRAMRLGWPTYLIHGTHHPEGVGRRVSAGCIRMLPNDIEYLFEYISPGTQVQTVHQPLKLGYLNGKWYFEAHPPLKEYRRESAQSIADKLLRTNHIESSIYIKAVREAIRLATGVPKKMGGV